MLGITAQETSPGSGSLLPVLTTGGTPIEITGYNLGATGAPLAVVYGPCTTTAPVTCNYRYTASIVSSVHTKLTVLAAPGVGAFLGVRVTVGGQVTTPASATLSYAPPSITTAVVLVGGAVPSVPVPIVDGAVIRLLPAWPPEWDVEFKLHAPANTVVNGTVKGGKLVRLDVTPASRLKDVEVMAPFRLP